MTLTQGGALRKVRRADGCPRENVTGYGGAAAGESLEVPAEVAEELAARPGGGWVVEASAEFDMKPRRRKDSKPAEEGEKDA